MPPKKPIFNAMISADSGHGRDGHVLFGRAWQVSQAVHITLDGAAVIPCKQGVIWVDPLIGRAADPLFSRYFNATRGTNGRARPLTAPKARSDTILQAGRRVSKENGLCHKRIDYGHSAQNGSGLKILAVEHRRTG